MHTNIRRYLFRHNFMQTQFHYKMEHFHKKGTRRLKLCVRLWILRQLSENSREDVKYLQAESSFTVESWNWKEADPRTGRDFIASFFHPFFPTVASNDYHVLRIFTREAAPWKQFGRPISFVPNDRLESNSSRRCSRRKYYRPTFPDEDRLYETLNISRWDRSIPMALIGRCLGKWGNSKEED